MCERPSFALGQWGTQIDLLLQHIRENLSAHGVDMTGFPQSAFDQEAPPSVVFAGQYSAGKSSLLQAITHDRTIAVGAGITTQETHTYSWRGLHLIDTPGICTGIRPDHDEIAYQAISKADMMVYVITYNLFDNILGNDFRRLLIDRHKAGETILVVNKMASVENTPESREIKKSDIQKVITPYTPDDLKTVFVDIQSYLESLDEPDDELRQFLYRRSNYEGLVSVLDSFAHNPDIFEPARLTTSLQHAQEFLQKKLSLAHAEDDNPVISVLQEKCIRERNLLLQTQSNLTISVHDIIRHTAEEIRACGRDLANTVDRFETQEAIDDAITDAQKQVDAIIEKSYQDIQEEITRCIEDETIRMDEFYNSDFWKHIQPIIQSASSGKNHLLGNIVSSDLLSKGSQEILSHTIGDISKNGLRIYSHSNAHNAVLNIGHFFGHQFKPWEAVKYVKAINGAAKFLGIAGVVINVASQGKEDLEEERNEQARRQNRESIRASFNDAARDTDSELNQALREFLASEYDSRIDKLSEQITQLQAQEENKSETRSLLHSAIADCGELNAKIRNSFSTP